MRELCEITADIKITEDVVELAEGGKRKDMYIEGVTLQSEVKNIWIVQNIFLSIYIKLQILKQSGSAKIATSQACRSHAVRPHRRIQLCQASYCRMSQV